MGLTVMDRKKDGTPKPRNKCRYWKITIELGSVVDESDRASRKRRRRTKSEYFHGTEKEARLREAELRVQLNRCDPSDIELEAFAREWLERKRLRVEHTTYMNTLAMVNTLARIFPHQRLQELDCATIEAAFTRFKYSRPDKPFSDTYISNLMATLEQVLRHAKKAGILQTIATEGVDKPSKRSKRRPAVPTMERVHDMVSMLDARDRNECCILMSATMGLRVGEALGCKWKDVDFDAGTIHIRRNMRHDGILANRTKTESSNRILPMTDFIMESLKARRDHLIEEVRAERSRKRRKRGRRPKGETESLSFGPALSESGQPSTAHAEPAQPSTALSEPAQPSTAHAEPAQPSTALSESGQPSNAHGASSSMLIDIDDLPVCAKADGSPTTTSSQTHWWLKNRDRFGMQGFTLHSLRHGYLSALASLGRTPSEMMRLAGHSSAQMTLEIYTHVNMREKVEAVRSLVSKLYPEEYVPKESPPLRA